MTNVISGTVSVAGGGTAVTLWSGDPLNKINLPVGSQVVIEGMANFVAAYVNTTDFTLQLGHEGTGGAGLSCAISANTPEEISIGKANRSLATVMSQISALDANGRGVFYNLISPTGDNDPGPGQMAMNNADPSLVSEIYLDILDANTNQEDVAALIDLWGTDTVITIRSIATAAYVSLKLNGSPVVVAGYRKCSVTYVGHSGVLGSEPVATEWNRSGTIGAPSGVNFIWDTASTDADPGLGKIRANNATLASATKLFVDDQAVGGADISAWVDSWDDSASPIKGTVIVTSESSPTTFYIFNITGAVTDDTGYRDVVVTYVAGQGALSDGDSVFLSFSRSGSDGAGTGDMIAANNLDDVVNPATALNNIGGVAVSALTGSVSMFAMDAPPSGWLKANGAAVSRTTYADLFAAIGTVYGVGDGSTTFNLPELRGEFIRGWDDGRGIDASRALGSAQTDQMDDHYHGVGATTAYTSGAAANAAGGTQQRTGAYSRWGGNVAGANAGSETRPRNVALLMCIKT